MCGVRVGEPFCQLVRGQILGDFAVVFVVGERPFLEGVVGDFGLGVIEIVEEEAEPLGRVLLAVLVDKRLSEVLVDAAVGIDELGHVEIDLSLEHAAEDQPALVRRIFANVLVDSDLLLIADGFVFLDDRVDLEVGLVRVVAVAGTRVLEGAVHDELGVGDLFHQGTAGLAAKRTRRTARNPGER